MGESVDIVVQETGTDEVSAKLATAAAAADATANSVDNVNQSLQFLQNASAAATSPVQAMADAVEQNGSAFDAQSKLVYNASTNMYDIVTAAQQARIALEESAGSADQMANSAGGAAEQLDQLKNKTDQHKDATDHAKDSTDHFTEATKLLKEALAALGLYLTAEKIYEMAEGFERLTIKLSSVSSNTHELEANMQALLNISNQTGSSFETNAGAFQKLSVETRGLGVSQKDLLGIVEGVNSAVRLSGGSTQDASRAMDIFGRALATGQVEGRIFRTVLRDFPELGQLVAKGLNVPVSSLVGFGSAAKTSAKDFVEGFNKAAQTTEAVAKTIPLTLGQALQTLSNSVLVFIGHLNESSGATALFATAIQFIANNFSTIARVVLTAAAGFASYYAIAVVIPAAINLITNSLRALTAAALANPFTFMVAALTTLIALVYQFGDSIKLTSDGSITLLGALIGTWNLLKQGILSVWEVVKGPVTVAFNALVAVVKAPFQAAIIIINSVISVLNFFGAEIAKLSPTLSGFGDTWVKAMQDASKATDDTGEHTKTLSQLLGGDDAGSLSGAANKAGSSLNTMNDFLAKTGVQMGRVNADAIPAFTNLVKQQEFAIEATKRASESMQQYSKDVDENNRRLSDLSVTTRDAMGNIIKYTDEAANQTAANYNKMTSAINSTTDALERQESAASSAAASTPSGGGGGGGGSGSGGTTSFQSWDPGDDLYGPYGAWTGGPGSPYFGHQLTAEELTKVQGIPGHFWSPSALKKVLGFATGGEFEVGGGGGTDSQLVQFMATPGEKVIVQTPQQQQKALAAGRNINVQMVVKTPDANSFNRSQRQTLMQLRSRLNTV